MSNQACHICNGLVDLIGMHPAGVKFCTCAENLLALRRQVRVIKAELREISIALDDPRVNLTITAVDKIKEMHSTISKLRSAIESIQWASSQFDIYGDGRDYCPECANCEEKGHTADCPIGSILKGEK